MKIFISGATGVLGRRVVKLLVAKGYQVVGLSRSEQNSEWLSQHGAEPRPGDLFNLEQVRQLSADCQAFLHLATAIPKSSRPAVSDWYANDRIRREGTQVLVEAALTNRCLFYLQQSVTFLYGGRQGEWVDETTLLPQRHALVLQSAIDMEHLVRDAVTQRGLPASILRFGTFYSYDSAQTASMFALLQKGMFPIIGGGGYYWNLIHVDDATQAVLSAVEGYPKSIQRTFNICDDEPVLYRDLILFLAKTLRARKPLRLPLFLARQLLGAHLMEVLVASARCKNQRVKDVLGWSPQYASYRQGMPVEIDRWKQAAKSTA